MSDNKINKFLLVTTILSVTIMLIGATFSYFTVSNRSKVDAVTVQAGKVSLGLSVSNLTSGIKLIPMNDGDVKTAFRQGCIDDNGFGACNIFEFTVSNFYKTQDIIGTINFEVNGIDNLKYMVLDDFDENNDNCNKMIDKDDNEYCTYVDKTSISNGTNLNLSLGEHFVLENGSEVTPATKNFKLIVWLSNFVDREQDDVDAGGTYVATANYVSASNGGILTGTVSGIG